jgi:hypothetical protein
MINHHTMFLNVMISHSDRKTIEYMIDLLKKRKVINEYKYKYLLLASKKNTHLDAIKYLVEEMDTYIHQYLLIPGVIDNFDGNNLYQDQDQDQDQDNESQFLFSNNGIKYYGSFPEGIDQWSMGQLIYLMRWSIGLI